METATLAESSLILWTGPKHSGKTTSAARLVQTVRSGGFVVAGCLAPAVHTENRLLGYDIVDLRTGRRSPLARRRAGQKAGTGFDFIAEGLELGNAALSPIATNDADLIVIDEFGPLELEFGGWRSAADRLANFRDAALLLVVREELIDEVLRVYRDFDARILDALQLKSTGSVLAIVGRSKASAGRTV